MAASKAMNPMKAKAAAQFKGTNTKDQRNEWQVNKDRDLKALKVLKAMKALKAVQAMKAMKARKAHVPDYKAACWGLCKQYRLRCNCCPGATRFAMR